MAAVRLARFNTRRKFIVCFSGAYHGWWDGVIAGLGSERPLDDCLTLKDLEPASLKVISRRAHRSPPCWSTRAVVPSEHAATERRRPADERVRKTEDSRERYVEWLEQLR